MDTANPSFSKYLFVCENKRPEGACCGVQGEKLRELLKEKVNSRGLSSQIRVSRSGCLDTCSEGPNVLLMPEGVWFKRVGQADVEKIIERAQA